MISENVGAHDGRFRRITFRFARWAPLWSGFFVVGALSHAAALALPYTSDGSRPWRHVLFLVINVSFAIGFALRWRGLLVPCIALVAQQLYSHGTDFFVAARAGQWDLRSLAVLASIPWTVLAAMGMARRDSRSAAAHASDS